MVSTPGLKALHLQRAAHFVAKPVESSCVAALVDKLLPKLNTGITLDPVQGCLEVEGKQLVLSDRGLDLLVTLAMHHPNLLTAAQLARCLFQNRGVLTNESAVRTAVSSLRRQVEKHGLPPLVDNQGKGYFLTRTPTLTSA
ncbi:MAG: hypothetical protein F4Z18_07290 [Caldilineaceae bacterium SB0666_bin_21]|nr:hypothetical protein [Caldilineaceae bacterium SB0666_bin_21]